MYQFSDSESKDSDEGIRFKTDTTRYKRDSRRKSKSRSRSRDSPRKKSSKIKKHHKRSRRSSSNSSTDSRKRSSKKDKYKKEESTRSHSPRRKHDSELKKLSVHRSSNENSGNSPLKHMAKYRKDEVKIKHSPKPQEINKIRPHNQSDSSSFGDSDSFGPTLPPQPSKLKKQTGDSTKDLESPVLPQPNLKNNIQSLEEDCAIGPILPSHLRESLPNTDSSGSNLPISDDKEVAENTVIGPALPPHLQKSEDGTTNSPNPEIIGPVLPIHLQKPESIVENQTSIKSASSPHLVQKETSPEARSIGPILPAHLREKLSQQQLNESNVDDDDEEIYGPMPEGANTSSAVQIALEERALKLKMDQLEPNEDQAPVREEWMIELPEVRAAGLGLGPRQFRAKPGPDLSDRSSWTDIANKKVKQSNPEVDLKKEAEVMAIKRRDKEQEAMSKKHKKHKQSLLEMHQDKVKKEKKAIASNERRPFSRDIDLQVNRFDEAQKKAVLKKAQLLDDRFSSGQSKFL